MPDTLPDQRTPAQEAEFLAADVKAPWREILITMYHAGYKRAEYDHTLEAIQRSSKGRRHD